MIPTVFVSSTVADLQHLRDAVRDRIALLGYTPVLSDHNGVGYVPTLSAVKSCFAAVKVSSIAVLIIGKRYGTLLDDGSGISVTHNEYRSARNANVPIFCLVDRDVLAYEKVFDANQHNEAIAFPMPMDHAAATFALLKEIRNAPTNNAILPYGNTTEACDALTTQLAHFFGSLLIQETNPTGRQISEVLSELTKLREEVRHSALHDRSTESVNGTAFVQATQLLASESYKQLRMFLSVISGGVAEAITDLISYASFDEYLSAKHVLIKYSDDDAFPHLPEGPERLSSIRSFATFLASPAVWSDSPAAPGAIEKLSVGMFVIGRENDVTMNHTAHRFLTACYSSIRSMSRDIDKTISTPPSHS